MKNSQKGFVILATIIIVLLAVGTGIYFYTKQDKEMVTDNVEKVLPSNGLVLAAQKTAITKQGIQVSYSYTTPDSHDKSWQGTLLFISCPAGVQATNSLNEDACKDQIGFPAQISFENKTGKSQSVTAIAKLFSGKGGGDISAQSNDVIVVIDPTCSNGATNYPHCNADLPVTLNQDDKWNRLTYQNTGITLEYPTDFKFDESHGYFTSPDYIEGTKGARVEFSYGLIDDRFENWQAVVAAMYGSASTNEKFSIGNKDALKTSYASAPERKAISVPFGQGKGFISLFLYPQTPNAIESYELTLEKMAESIVGPVYLTDKWVRYENPTYGFSFSHPSLSSVTTDSTYLANSIASYRISIRNGFNAGVLVFLKPTNQSIDAWRLSALKDYDTQTSSKLDINGHSAFESVLRHPRAEGGIRYRFIENKNVVIGIPLSESYDGKTPLEYQKFLDSFAFTDPI